MTEAVARLHLRRQLEEHLAALGYSGVRRGHVGTPVPEVLRVSPVRGKHVYGETVLRSDLRRRSCQERLLFFSKRRTRRRGTIMFFIGVAEDDASRLDALLVQLEIRSALRGGHVHIVPIAMTRAEPRAARSAS